ncbi:MAG: hypothetical protein HS111_10155 [Kofleriaceae bacterium]|nr:hypothetical protein [Kofleriaceae bacterium]
MKKKRDRKALHARETSRLLAHLVVLSPGGVMPDPLELVRSHRELVEALVMRLGGLDEARDQAGPRAAGGRPRWTQGRVVVELRAHAAAGRVLLTQLPRSLQSAIYTRFGSLPKAREAAGMVRAWTRDQVVKELHAHAAKGRRTTATLPKALRAVMVAQFGSVDAARTAAGIEVQVRRRWTRERVVEELRAHAVEGRTSTKQLPPMLWVAMRSLFGGAHAARAAAGIEGPPTVRRWTRDRVVEELRAHAASGRISTSQLPDTLCDAMSALFGGVQAARAAAGIEGPVGRARWTRERVVEELRAHAVDGRTLTSQLPATLVVAATRQFGTLEAARTAAQISPAARRHARRPRPEA